jgi:hypothetical protein
VQAEIGVRDVRFVMAGFASPRETPSSLSVGRGRSTAQALELKATLDGRRLALCELTPLRGNSSSCRRRRDTGQPFASSHKQYK